MLNSSEYILSLIEKKEVIKPMELLKMEKPINDFYTEEVIIKMIIDSVKNKYRVSYEEGSHSKTSSFETFTKGENGFTYHALASDARNQLQNLIGYFVLEGYYPVYRESAE